MKTISKIGLVASYVVLIIAVVIFIGPIFWLFITSLKPAKELFSMSLPHEPTLGNYLEVLRIYPVGTFLLNSLQISITSTLVALVIGSIAAYGFSRYTFPLQHILIMFILVMRMLAPVSLAIPLYLLFSRVGFLDTKIALIFTYSALTLPLVIWIMQSFFEDIPRELDEAGQIDGCTRWSVLYRVIFPVSAPGLAVTAIFAFLQCWNEFMFALILTSTPETQTMPVGLSQMTMLYGIRWDHMSAGSMMYIIPTIIMALILQKYIIRGLTLGAVKG